MRVRCRVCLRRELWTGQARAVEVEGGQRRPEGPPALAAFRTLRASGEGALGPVVGPCPACGQPLVADRPVAAVPWTFPLATGELVVQGPTLTGPEGPISAERAEALLQAIHGEPWRPGRALFQGALLGVMSLPMLLWALALFVVLWFLYNVLYGTVGF